MEDQIKQGIAEFLSDTIVKYSQALIYWREQSNNENNSPIRAKECETNTQRYTIIYNELKSLINEL